MMCFCFEAKTALFYEYPENLIKWINSIIHKNKESFNINIFVIDNKQVIISKVNNPITNFVIYHPMLINAIQNFVAPINEKNISNIK